MKSKHLLLLLVFFVLSASSGWSSDSRPNIVFILVDDLGYDELNAYGGRTGFYTPNIDQLAEAGVRFTHAMAYSMCSPSRAAMLSGRHGIRTGIISNVADPGGVGRLLGPDEYTFAESLRDGGYATGLFGKLHLHWDSVSTPDLPKQLGFEDSFAYLGVPISGSRGGGVPIGRPAGGMVADHFNVRWVKNGEVLGELEGYSSDLMTDEAIKFIGRDHNRPFLVWLPYFGIHEPFQAPERWRERFPIDDEMRSAFELSVRRTRHGGQMRDIEGLANYNPSIQQFRNRLAMAAALDENVGRVMTALSEAGIEDNTLVVLVGDNGPHPVAGGGKARPVDAAVRVPLIMRWPGHIPAGRVSPALVEATDFHATFTYLAGARTPEGLEMDGHSLLPLDEEALNQKRPLSFSSLKGTLLLADHEWFYSKHVAIPDSEKFYRRMTPPNQIQEPTPEVQVPEDIKLRFRQAFDAKKAIREAIINPMSQEIQGLRQAGKDPYYDRLQEVKGN